MKSKIPYFYLGISLILNLFLCIYVATNKPECELTHLEDIDRTSVVVPDEETAKIIAKAVVDADEDWEWVEEFTYDVDVSFDEDSNEWKVHYLPRAKEPGIFVLDGEKIVWIRKDNGLISSLY